MAGQQILFQTPTAILTGTPFALYAIMTIRKFSENHGLWIDTTRLFGYYTIMTNDEQATKERKGMGLTATKFRHRAAAAKVMQNYVRKTGLDNLTIRRILVKLNSGLMGVRFIIVRKEEDDYATR